MRNTGDFPRHCDKKKAIGVDTTTGSLGQGTSLAAGRGLGDGESNEGQVWEVFMFAVTEKFSDHVVLLDNNKKQLDGYVKGVAVFATGIVIHEAFKAAEDFPAETVRPDCRTHRRNGESGPRAQEMRKERKDLK